MGVLAIWRYPIKAMLGEALAAARVTRAGIDGDRRWLVVDRGTGEPIANKRGRTHPALRACRATGGDEAEPLRVTLPDGATAHRDEIADALSELLRAPLELRQAPNRDAALGAPAAHHDFAPLHVMTTGKLERLRREEPASDWDVRRFRPNLLLAGDRDLVGSELHARSGLKLRVAMPTPRCVVPTRATEELPADPALLKAIARRHMADLGPFGHSASLGTYADVAAEGHVTTGEQLAVAPGTPLDATLATLAERFGLED